MNEENVYNHAECRREWDKRHRRGKVAGGVLLVAIGVLFFMKRAGVEFPEWLFSWKMLLIALGIISGIKHGFKRFMWIVPVLIGTAFIVSERMGNQEISKYIWPVIIIMVGLFVILKPRRSMNQRRWQRMHRHHYRFNWKEEANAGTDTDNEDYMDASNVFGGFKKHVVSKNFKGGEMTNFFGGGELNLTQADISGKVSLEITAVFGGVKLIVPRNWDVQSEITTFCGGIEDKRAFDASAVDGSKILVLKGNAVFGGIDIVSY